jgi:hypothetical protein
MNQELYLLHLLVAGLGGGQSDGDDPSDNPAADQRLSDDAANNNMDLETRDPPPQSPGVHHGNNSSYSSLPGAKSVAAGAVECEAGQKSVHVSPTLSLPGRLNYDMLDDGVWDHLDAPMHIDVDDVEENAICHLGEKSANLSYCSQLLAVVNNEDSDEEELGLGDSAEDSHLACLDKEVCDKLSGAKRTLLPFLDEVSGKEDVSNLPIMEIQKPKKQKWGPVVAMRKSSRNHGGVNILDKAKEYQKKKNLEIPPYFKGNSFAVLDHVHLGDISDDVDIMIGGNNVDKLEIVQLLIDKELDLNHEFARNNPESVLPSQEDLCPLTNKIGSVSNDVSMTVTQGSSQLIDLESGIKTAPWTLVQSRKKKHFNDRRDMEH